MKEVLLKEICDVRDGTHDSPKYVVTGYPLVTSKNVTGGKIDLTNCNFITEEDYKKINKRSKVDQGDIIMPMIGTVGQPVIVDLDVQFAIKNVALIKFPDKSSVLNTYIKFLLESDYFDRTVYSKIRGGTQKFLSLNDIRMLKIPLPPINKQNKIVMDLSSLNSLISKRRQQLASLDLLVKARFVEMFGDPVSNSKSYPVYQLSKYIEFLTSGSRGWAQYCTDNGTEWFITIKNVKDCHILVDNMQPIDAPNNAEAKRTKVQEGDLLISITADLGRTGVVTKEIAEHGAYINQHLTCIRLNTEVVNPLYVAHFMESSAGKEQFKSKNQSAVKAGLNFNSINSLRITVPPMKIQNEFVNFVSRVDKAKFAAQKSLQELETLKKSLMQQYFG